MRIVLPVKRRSFLHSPFSSAVLLFGIGCAACSSSDSSDGTNAGPTSAGGTATASTGQAMSTTSAGGATAGTSGGETSATSGSSTGTGATGTGTTGGATAGGTGQSTSSTASSTATGGGTTGTVMTTTGDGGGPSSSSGDGGATDGNRGDAGHDAAVDAGRAREGGSAGEGGASCAGHALSLSGNSAGSNDTAKQVMHADLGADLPAGNSHRTIEYWAYVPAATWVGNVNTMFFYGSTTRPSSANPYAHGFGLDFGSNAVNGNHTTLDPFTNGGYDNDNQPSGLSANPPDQWVHFAMVWDGTSVRTFVNGVLRITTMSDGSATGLATDTSPIQVGAYEQENAYFNGAFDEFRVWNVDRSASEIASTMHSALTGQEPGVVAYYKFDETSGTSAADSVTAAGHTAHNGTLMSANGQPKPTFIVSTAPIACP